MKVLFIGGTGIISAACSKVAVAKGVELYHLNRGQSHRIVDGVKHILGDIRQTSEIRNTLSNYRFDVVVNWINFLPEHVLADIELFSGKTKQYIFISSASAYQKPIEKLPITEDTPLINPFWQYSRDKAACEEILFAANKKRDFPVTIVRPSHTYDDTLLPTDWGYTVIDRMKRGKKIIIPGDGTSIWVMTQSSDFAVGFCSLLGNQAAIGEAFHITSDELLNWNQIYQTMAKELGVILRYVHIPSDFIAKYDEGMGANLLGDKAHSVIFDNSKIRKLAPHFKAKVPFNVGIKQVLSWYAQYKTRQVVDREIDALIDRIITAYEQYPPLGLSP